jgi:periplasmic divalent cation tolerance protein
MPQPLLVLSTAPNEDEAARIARALVEDRLAACVNIVVGARSIYRWQGAIEDSSEAILLIKSDRRLFAELSRRLVALHPYTTPEIIAVHIDSGSEPYLAWLASELKPAEAAQ